jgi:hypothetical protein
VQYAQELDEPIIKYLSVFQSISINCILLAIKHIGVTFLGHCRQMVIIFRPNPQYFLTIEQKIKNERKGKLFLFLTENDPFHSSVCISHKVPRCVLHAPLISTPWLHSPTSICWSVQIIYCSYSLRSFLQPSVTSALVSPNIPNCVFKHLHFLNVRDHVSHLYKTRGKIIVVFLDSKRKTKRLWNLC